MPTNYSRESATLESRQMSDPCHAPEYNEGMTAFTAGKHECPYQPDNGLSMPRYFWWRGYFDARLRQNCPRNYPES